MKYPNGKRNNLPEKYVRRPVAISPLNQLMRGGMPGVPDLFRDAFPPNLPSLPYEAGFIKRKLHKGKIRDLIEIKKFEAEGAEADARKFKDNIEKITEAVMFGPRIMDQQAEFYHKREMRTIAVQEGHARLRLMDLEAQEKEAVIQKLGYETALIAQEVELSKLENEIKRRQIERTLNEEEY